MANFERDAEGMVRSDLPTDFLANSLLGMLRAYVRDSGISSDLSQKSELLGDLFLNGACNANDRLAVHYSGQFQSDK